MKALLAGVLSIVLTCVLVPAGALAGGMTDIADGAETTGNVGTAGDVETAGNAGTAGGVETVEDGNFTRWAYRLLVGFDSESQVQENGELQVQQGGVLLDACGSVALMGYESQSARDAALAYYDRKARFAAADDMLYAAFNQGKESDYEGCLPVETPFAQLDAAETGVPGDGPIVALIDTGAPVNASVAARVSVLGDDPGDDSGHGSRMLERILAENPDARVVSIKALDAEGKGTVASVYAAILYALDVGANIISLSFSAYAPEGNAAIASIVGEAASRGVRIVAAAGNDNNDARFYIPAGADGVIAVGAMDGANVRQPVSNWGPAVSVWVEAGSTSEAAARLAGWLSTQETSVDVAECPFSTTIQPSEPTGADDSLGGGESGAAEPDDFMAQFLDSPYFDPDMQGQKRRYRISYHSNGGTGTMLDDQVELEYGTMRTTRLSACAFIREGYSFAGWKTNIASDGAGHITPVVIPDAQELHNLSWMVERDGDPWNLTLLSYEQGGEIELSAVWRRVDTGELEDVGDVTTYGVSPVFSANTSSTSYYNLYRLSLNGEGVHGYLTNDPRAEQTFFGYTFRSPELLGQVPSSSSTPFYGVNSGWNPYQWVWGSLSERNNLIAAGWRAAGLDFYSDDARAIPVYRFYNGSSGAHNWGRNASWPGFPSREDGGIFYVLRFYKVAFNGNGATSGSMSTNQYQYGIDYNLPANGFSKTGYTFTGWSGSNGKSYSNRQSFSNLTTASGATITMTAQWSANTYTVAFDANGGGGYMPSQPAVYGTSFSLRANSFTRAGYRFVGWNTLPNGTGTHYDDCQSVSNLANSQDATATLYAQWEPIQLEVSVPNELGFGLRAAGHLELSGNETSIDNETCASVAIFGVRVTPAPGLAFVEGAPAANECSLTLHVGEKGSALLLADFVKPSFQSPGDAVSWSIPSKSKLGIGLSHGMCGSLSDAVLKTGRFGKVEWRFGICSATISYQANGGSGTMSDQQVSSGLTFAAPSCCFAYPGKAFAGWNTRQDGTGDSYAAGDAFTPSADTVLFAQWR